LLLIDLPSAPYFANAMLGVRVFSLPK